MGKRAPGYGKYQEEKPRDTRIAGGWFCDGWLPFAGFGGGSILLISDTSPSVAGTCGQVIAFVHDPDEIVFVAASFSSFLEASLAALNNEAEEYFLALE